MCKEKHLFYITPTPIVMIIYLQNYTIFWEKKLYIMKLILTLFFEEKPYIISAKVIFLCIKYVSISFNDIY